MEDKLWQKGPTDALLIVDLMASAEALANWQKNEFERLVTNWDLQKDKAVGAAREALEASLLKANVLLTESGYMTVLTTTEEGSTAQKAGIQTEESYRKSRKVKLQEVHRARATWEGRGCVDYNHQFGDDHHTNRTCDYHQIVVGLHRVVCHHSPHPPPCRLMLTICRTH